MHIERTVIIACPPERVWPFVADARNDPEWCPKVDSVEQVAGDGPDAGARYRVFHRPRPGRPAVELSTEIVAFEEPRRLALRESDEDGVFNVVYELEPGEEGTRFPQIDDIEWNIPWLAYPIARAMVRRDLGRQLGLLKKVLEAR